MVAARNKIQDVEYEIEANQAIQKKQLAETQSELTKKKQLRDRAQMKFNEQKQKSVYLKTAFTSILDKLGAIRLLPEDHQSLMQGDDVFTDALLAGDRRIFESFSKQAQSSDCIDQTQPSLQYQLLALVILSKLKWFNEMEKELDDIVAQQKALEASQLMQKTEDFEMEEDVDVNDAIDKLADLQQAQSITIPKE